jgi:hypothetical protein
MPLCAGFSSFLGIESWFIKVDGDIVLEKKKIMETCRKGTMIGSLAK